LIPASRIPRKTLADVFAETPATDLNAGVLLSVALVWTMLGSFARSNEQQITRLVYDLAMPYIPRDDAGDSRSKFQNSLTVFLLEDNVNHPRQQEQQFIAGGMHVPCRRVLGWHG
jgi:hypothetical protein